jgi:3',5'-cyclic AMP phosphodiesterase CpdA
MRRHVLPPLVSRRIGGLAIIWAVASACDDPCTRLGTDAPSEPLVRSGRVPGGLGSFAVIGDTQRTSLGECVLGREVNDDDAMALLEGIALWEPAFVVHLGDMVFKGRDPDHWRWFDARTRHFERTPILPVLGNHDVGGSPERSLPHVRARFPRLAEATWYADRYGPIGLIWLDSTDGRADWTGQLSFLSATLEEFDGDPEVDGVLVFAHHPPFTNSPVVEGDRRMRSDVVPLVCGARKALGLIAGHAHTYEHFVRDDCDGRTFLVSGGGGAPRPSTLRSGDDAEARDLYDGPAPRPLHALRLAPDEDGVAVEAAGIDDDDGQLAPFHTFRLDYRR